MYRPMNPVIKSPTPLPEKTGLTVFLAGPMKGAPKWQRTVPKLAESLGIDGVTHIHKTLEGCLKELKEELIENH